MGFKTLQNTSVQADVLGTDILAIARGTGSLSNVVVSALVTYLQTGLATASGFLKASNNLSDLTAAATARSNLGLGTSATHAATDFVTSVAPSFTGGVTLAGSTKQNVTAVVPSAGAAAIDLTLDDFYTMAIASATTVSFTGATASTAQGFILELTITSAAVPTWPASVHWAGAGSGATAPVLGNGRHVLGFVTFNGGTVWTAMVGAFNA